MALGEPLAEFDIDSAAVSPVDDARLEPILLADPLRIDFDEEAQFESQTQWDGEHSVVVGVADWNKFDELDLERLEEPADAPLTATRPRASAIGVVGSVGVHLLVLLGLLAWGHPAGKLAAPIPVQLVVMPERAPDNQATPMEVNGAATTPPKSAAAAPPPPPSPPPAAPSAKKPVRLRHARPPKRSGAPHPAPEPIRPSPIPVRKHARSSPPPRPEATRGPPSAAETPSLPTPAIAAPRPALASQGAAPGPAMTLDQYYAYLVALTRQHLDLLPQSVVAGRSGRALVSVQVSRDGTITNIGIAETSGYPDIDYCIEQMVAAVGRFPPLPAVFQGPSANLEFRLLFPDVYRQQ